MKKLRSILAIAVLLAMVLVTLRCLALSYSDSPTVTEVQEGVAERLRADVERLCSEPRRGEPSAGLRAELVQRLEADGWQVREQAFPQDGETMHNIIAVREGRSGKRYIVGAHYDACDTGDNPGADDNASAVAVLLELAHRLPKTQPEHTLELVFYACEEPPWFGKPGKMGSAHHARSCNPRKVLGMICLEMLGYYSDAEGSQPSLFPGSGLILPDKGNFVAVVGDWDALTLARRAHNSLAETMSALRLNLPFAHGTALYFSDHRNYYGRGIPSIMVTDTAMLRNSNYHEPTDTPDSLDYTRMARVTQALISLLQNLAY